MDTLQQLPGGRASFIHAFEPVEDGRRPAVQTKFCGMRWSRLGDARQTLQEHAAVELSEGDNAKAPPSRVRALDTQSARWILAFGEQ